MTSTSAKAFFSSLSGISEGVKSTSETRQGRRRARFGRVKQRRSAGKVAFSSALQRTRGKEEDAKNDSSGGNANDKSRRQLLQQSLFSLAASALCYSSTDDTANIALAAYGNAPGGADADDDVSTAKATFDTFYGAAEPPGTYGKVGGTTKNRAKYSYEVPTAWKEEATSKVEKGTGGQDSRFVALSRDSKGAKAVCITLNRAGEDGQEFSLQQTTLNALAGADPTLQDAILVGTTKTTKFTQDGLDFVHYDVDATTSYGIKATVDANGRLFAFVVSAPEAVYRKNKPTFERMLASFRTYVLDTTK